MGPGGCAIRREPGRSSGSFQLRLTPESGAAGTILTAAAIQLSGHPGQQGGEKHALTGFSFVASRNYGDAAGRDLVRVVSCNTTALGRVVGTRHRA